MFGSDLLHARTRARAPVIWFGCCRLKRVLCVCVFYNAKLGEADSVDHLGCFHKRVREAKVLMLNDLAHEFQLSTHEVIDRLQMLEVGALAVVRRGEGYCTCAVER